MHYDAVGARVDQVPIEPYLILRALDRKAQGESARFGPASFPQVDFGETLLVPTPEEGGDGTASNEFALKKHSKMRGASGTMSQREEALKKRGSALTTDN